MHADMHVICMRLVHAGNDNKLSTTQFSVPNQECTYSIVDKLRLLGAICLLD